LELACPGIAENGNNISGQIFRVVFHLYYCKGVFMINLSQRLQALADFVPSGMRIADIGTDHAFLPCYLVRKGISPGAIGVEVRKGPYDSARRTVRSCNLEKLIDLRLGNGLVPLREGETEVIIIAGMGGALIAEILESSPQIIYCVSRLVLQPMNGAEIVRSWLYEKGWMIIGEELVKEDGRIYQIIAAEKGSQGMLTEAELLYGPVLIKESNPLLPELLQKDLQLWQEILHRLAKSRSEATAKKRITIKERIHLIKGLIECLSTVRQ
jgi:tRNA (adenine22-N1)-methyltransferase